MAEVELGPFVLEAPIGRGGMAEVWRGRHARQQLPVAVKVITAARAKEQRFKNAFTNEVQAVASLGHPGIVHVLDHGEVTRDASEASGGRLAENSPYLVMELASWGSLDKMPTPLRPDELFRVLSGLLDALAHAHARGVIHRDLKPGNVLLAAPFDARPGFKLTDFGIAHALDAEGLAGEASSGTPHYMAPEQFLGSWRDYGAWTDLYALGCMAYVLSTGRLPYEGESSVQLAYGHLHRPLPPLLEEDLPPNFQAWVHCLLEKNPRHRFQRAADAAYALHQIRPSRRSRERKKVGLEPAFVPTDLHTRAQAKPSTELTPTLHEGHATQPSLGAVVPTHHQLAPGPDDLKTLVELNAEHLALPWLGDPSSDRSSGSVRAFELDEVATTVELVRRPKVELPPLPSSWRRGEESNPGGLVGAGLGLYGLRTVPLVDRDLERDRLWAALRSARESREARFVVLRGAAGNGKSRLVEWVTQRADEVGSALVLKATHGPSPGPSDGLNRMVARQLRTVDLSRDKTKERIQRLLGDLGVSDQDEVEALVELVHPAPGGARGVRLRQATERHVLIARHLLRLSAERPVIVWIEDAHWGSDAIAFALYLERTQRESPAPILLVLTVRDEALAERPVEERLLEQLASKKRVERLSVPPLLPDDQKRLVNALLVFEENLALQVAKRTAGNPLFLVQLVGDWVSRGVLEVAKQGFVLRANEAAELPDDLHQVWSRRLAQVLENQPESAQRTLELAATLGQTIDAGEWHEACRLEGLSVPPLLLIQLFESRLGHATDGGFAFAHGMLRESLERAAKEAGRLEDHHKACAAMLEPRNWAGAPGVAERFGRHLLLAGDKMRALRPLLKGAEERVAASEFQEALLLLKLRDDLLFAVEAPEKDPAYSEGYVLRARIHTATGHFEEAERFAIRAEALARRHNLDRMLPEALATRASLAYERGDATGAIAAYKEARELYERQGETAGVAQCWAGLGDVTYRLGDHPSAEDLFRCAIALFETVPGGRAAPGMQASLLNLGFVTLWRGDTVGAAIHFRRQLAILEELGDRLKLARCVGALGEVARQAGKLDEAEAHYRRALAIDEAIGSKSTLVDRLNLGLVLLARGQYAEARTVIDRAATTLGDNPEPAQSFMIHCQLLPSLAEARAFSEWDEHFALASRLLSETGITDGDVAWLFGLAAERAEERGDPTRARAAYELALRQWRALGRTDRADAITRRLE